MGRALTVGGYGGGGVVVVQAVERRQELHRRLLRAEQRHTGLGDRLREALAESTRARAGHSAEPTARAAGGHAVLAVMGATAVALAAVAIHLIGQL